MNINYSRHFDQQFHKLPRASKQLVRDTIEIFIDDPFNEDLRNHPLKDRWEGYRSVSADNDLRLHYRIVNKSRVLFVAVGTHDELYKN